MAKIKHYALSWHRKLLWVAGIALLLFAFSGLLHPVMVWTGPKAQAFFPPQTSLTPAQVAAVPSILNNYQLTRAAMVKVVASKSGPVLQFTPPKQDGAALTRRYFDLNTGLELNDYGVVHALWLAQYYTGLPSEQVSDVSLQHQFDNAYPWVNRLLPVYRVSYAQHEGLTVYLHTETNALASISDNDKRSLQTIFSWLHTWSWLDDVEYVRIVLMALILVLVLGLVVSGAALVFSLKKRRIADAMRRWHRGLAAYVLWLPLVLLTISGLYHLLQAGLAENHRGMRLGAELKIDPAQLAAHTGWLERYQNLRFNGLSLVQNSSAELLYRLSLPQGRHGENISANKRFDGSPIERSAIYINPKTGQELDYDDQTHAQALLAHFVQSAGNVNWHDSLIVDSQLITRFGVHYDFRNKRLPVWMFTLDSAAYKGEGALDAGLSERVFIDPASGILVDRLVDPARFEAYSFSFLHKWNFLKPLLGRAGRDAAGALVMLATLAMGVLGLWLYLGRRKRRR